MKINRILLNYDEDASPIFHALLETHGRLWVLGEQHGHLQRRRFDYLKAYKSYIGLEWLPWESWLVAERQEVLYPSMSLYYMKKALEETKEAYPFALESEGNIESLARDLLAYQDEVYRSEIRTPQTENILLNAMYGTVTRYEEMVETREALAYYPALLRGRDALLNSSSWEVGAVVLDMVTKLWPWQVRMIEEMERREIPVYILTTEATVPERFQNEQVKDQRRSGRENFHTLVAAETGYTLAKAALRWAFERRDREPAIIWMQEENFLVLERTAEEWQIPLCYTKKTPLWKTQEGVAVRQWLESIVSGDRCLPQDHPFAPETLGATAEGETPLDRNQRLSTNIVAVSAFWYQDDRVAGQVWYRLHQLAADLERFAIKERLSILEEYRMWEEELKGVTVEIKGATKGIRVMSLEESMAERTGPRFYMGLDQALNDRESLLFYRTPLVEQDLKEKGLSFSEERTDAVKRNLARSMTLARGVVAGGFVIDADAEDPLTSGANWLGEYVGPETERVLRRRQDAQDAPVIKERGEDRAIVLRREACRRREQGDEAYRGQWHKDDVPMEGRVSVTAIERFARCPFRDGWESLFPQEDPLSTWHKDLGTVLHQTLEAVYRETLKDLEEPLEIWPEAAWIRETFSIFWEGMFGESEDVFLPLQKEFWTKKLLTWIEKDHARLLKMKDAYHPAAVETSFEIPMSSGLGGWLTGKIDRIDENEKGQKILVDYKTNYTPTNRDREEGISLQMGLYAYAAGFNTVDAVMYGSIKRGSTSYLWQRDGVEAGKFHGRVPKYSQEQLNGLLDDVEQLIDRKRQGAFLVEPRKCDESRCAFYGICRYQGGEEDESAAESD